MLEILKETENKRGNLQEVELKYGVDAEDINKFKRNREAIKRTVALDPDATRWWSKTELRNGEMKRHLSNALQMKQSQGLDTDIEFLYKEVIKYDRTFCGGRRKRILDWIRDVFPVEQPEPETNALVPYTKAKKERKAHRMLLPYQLDYERTTGSFPLYVNKYGTAGTTSFWYQGGFRVQEPRTVENHTVGVDDMDNFVLSMSSKMKIDDDDAMDIDV